MWRLGHQTRQECHQLTAEVHEGEPRRPKGQPRRSVGNKGEEVRGDGEGLLEWTGGDVNDWRLRTYKLWRKEVDVERCPVEGIKI